MLKKGTVAIAMACVYGLLFGSCTHTSLPVEPVVKLDSSGKVTIAFEYTPLQNARIKPGFALFLLQQDVPVSYPVACKSEVVGDSLFIEPVFELGRGLSFQFQLYIGADTIRKNFNTLPARMEDKAYVQQVFPLTDKVPSNILMFHVVFSSPMQQDPKAFQHIFIYDEHGNQKHKIWREKSNWTQGGRHLVLMIHPGRIKHGIDYDAEGGPLFEQGKQYRLVIDTSLKDQYNRPLKQEGSKIFTITAADSRIPVFNYDTTKKINPGSKNPFLFEFSEGMDYGAMQIGFTLTDKGGKKTPGRIEPVTDKSWTFIPETLWAQGPYQLELNDYTTDFAGNHLVRKFEEASLEDMNKRHTLTFRIR
jgi:hypothetical protein